MPDSHPILLFDGTCKFCNATVDFVFAHERGDEVRFMWLQDKRAQAIIDKHAIAADTDSLILIEGDQVYLRSDGALRLARYLKSPWSWLSRLGIFPVFLRDAIYRLIARYRKKIMGSTTCALPIGRGHRFL